MNEGAGMTDKQFIAYVRQVKARLEKVKDENDEAKARKELEEIIEDLDKTIK